MSTSPVQAAISGIRVAPATPAEQTIGPVTATVSSPFAALAASAPWPIASLQVRCPRVRLPNLGGDAMLVSNGLTTIGVVLSTTYTAICDQWADDPAAGLVTIWTIAPVIPGADGVTSWNLSSTDGFVAADLDGDGVDELFVWNPDTGSAVLKWTGTGFSVVAQTGATLPPGSDSGGQGWTFLATDQLYAGDFDGDGSDELLLFYPDLVADGLEFVLGRIAVAGWTGAAIELEFYSAGSVPAGSGASWPFQGDEQVLTPALGLTGTALVLFSPSWATIGVGGWNADAAQLQMVWTSGIEIPAAGDATSWPVNGTDVYATARLNGQIDYLVLFSPTLPTVGVAAWSETDMQLEVLWSNWTTLGTNGDLTVSLTGAMLPSAAALAGGADWVLFSTPGSLAAGSWDGTQLLSQWQSGATIGQGGASWTPGSGDQYRVISGGTAGTDRVLALNPGSNAAAQLGWDGTTMSVPWQATSNVPGWSGAVLAGGPSTAFVSFESDASLQAAYVYISNQLYFESQGNIRGIYDSANIDDGDPMSWAAELQSLPCPADIPEDAWNTVVAVLQPELEAVSGSRSYYSTLVQMQTPLQNQQLADLATVGGLIPPVQQPESELTYWIDQVLEALVWIASAAFGGVAEVGAGVAAGLSGAASLFGSYLGDPANNHQPYQVPYEQLNGLISADYVSAFAVAKTLSETCVNDAIKGPLLASLAVGTWNVTLLDESNVPASIQDADQLSFFQLLIPAAYRIGIWPNNDEPYPTKLTGNKWHPEAPLGSPTYAYWSEQISQDGWNVYLLWTGDDTQEYPSEAMMTALFALPGVAKDDLFLGRAAWSAIPRDS